MEGPKYFQIRKSKNDKHQYVYKTLQNGLKCVLIYDKDADKSAAALTVNVGSLSDPEEYQGLAHFLEHMLFMGTEKYPNENDFSEFLSKNSGDSNAYTGLECTQYYFDVKNEAFSETLDKFAQFFLSPLFNKSAVEREMKAVESEHKKNTRSDANRFLEVFRVNSEPSPFQKFQTGNIQTLKKPGVRKILKKFHNEFYSSNIMNLCVLSNIELNTLEILIDNLFSGIKNLNLNLNKDIRSNFIPDKLYPYQIGKNLSHFYKILNVKDKNTLSFYWIINENVFPMHKYDPFEYIVSLLHHEGKNSLTSSLLKDELITDLDSSYEVISHTFTQVYVNAHLTEKGFKNCDEIIRRVIGYVQTLQQLEVNKSYFDEIKNMTQVDFDFFEKDEPINYCSDIADNMSYYNPEDILTGPYLIEFYSEELIKKYLNTLHLENLNIYLCSNKFEKEFNEQKNLNETNIEMTNGILLENNHNEPLKIFDALIDTKNIQVLTEIWYGTKYKKMKFNFEKFFYLNSDEKSNYNFNYPPKNHFIPDDFELKNFIDYDFNLNFEKNSDLKTIFKNPLKILSKDNFYNIFYKPDLKFKIPKAYFCAQIYLPFSHYGTICSTFNSTEEIDSNLDYAHYETYLTLWQNLIFDELRETIYMASLARIDFSLCNNKMGFELEFSGFNSTLKKFSEEIFTLLQKISDYKNIDNFYNKLLINIEHRLRLERNSFKASANAQVSHRLNSFLTSPHVCMEKSIHILETLKKQILNNTKNKFEFFVTNYFSRCFFEWLVQGNIYPEKSLEIIFYIQNILQKNGMKFLEINQIRTVKISDEQNFFNIFSSQDLENENSAIISYFQIGYLKEKDSCLLELVEQILYDKFFDELRTKQALGYLVSLSHKFSRKVEGVTCLVQSSVQCPEFIREKIDKFFDDFNLTDENNIKDEDFENFKESIIVSLKQKDLTLAEEVDGNFGEIKNREFRFNRDEERIKIYENQVTKKDVMDFYEEHFIKNVRRFDFELVAKQHLTDNEKLLQQSLKKTNSTNDVGGELDMDMDMEYPQRTVIKNEESFKRMCELYPDYYYYVK